MNGDEQTEPTMFDSGNDDNGNQFTEAFAKATGFSQGAMTLYMIWKAPFDRYTQKPGASPEEAQQVFARLMREAKWKDDDGVRSGAPKGLTKTAPTSSPKASGEVGGALPKGPSGVSSPARLPGRDLTVQGEIAKQVAQSVLDSFKVRDGRSIGDVRFGEIDTIAFTDAVEAAVLLQCKMHARAPHDSKVRDVIGKKQLEQFIANAERQARKIQENGNV